MLPRRIEELLDDTPERWCCQDVFIPRHECCSRRRTADRPLGGHGVEGWLVAAGRGGASGRDDGAAFPRRLSRKNALRRPPLSNGENSYLKRTPVHSSPAGLCLPPTSIVSPLFSDSLIFIFLSGPTTARASLEALVHRRVAAAYTDWLIAENGIASHHAASRSGIRLLLLLILAIAASGRFPPLPGPRSRRTGTSKGPSPEGWPI